MLAALRRARLPLASRIAASRHRTLCSGSGLSQPAVQNQIQHISQINGESLYFLAKVEGPAQVNATRERLRREIMRVDNVDYSAATPKLLELNQVNSKSLFAMKLPYRLMWGTAVFSGWASLPLVFSLSVAKPFNTALVTTEVPAASELNTLLEVGAWTWNWMEPPLGTISFFLLAMQFAREASNNLGNKTPTQRHKEVLAVALTKAFPMYHSDAVRDYAMATAFDCDADEIEADSKLLEEASCPRQDHVHQ